MIFFKQEASIFRTLEFYAQGLTYFQKEEQKNRLSEEKLLKKSNFVEEKQKVKTRLMELRRKQFRFGENVLIYYLFLRN